MARALSTQSQCLIEAGTGVGKTFAYLVPALFARKRVIVSTGTRTLQDQLFHRDLPVIARGLGVPVKVAMLKGRSNYLCLHRLELAEREAASNRRAREPLRLINKIRQWSHVTARGDINELNELPEQEPIWQSVTSTRENCVGSECSFFSTVPRIVGAGDAHAADVGRQSPLADGRFVAQEQASAICCRAQTLSGSTRRINYPCRCAVF